MHAAVLEGPSKITIRDIPVPKPGPHELLVRVAAVGLCGTDIHIFRGEGNYNMDATGRVIPLEEQAQILGHEFCGEVAEVGSEVKGIRATRPHRGGSGTQLPQHTADHPCASTVRPVIRTSVSTTASTVSPGCKGRWRSLSQCPLQMRSRSPAI